MVTAGQSVLADVGDRVQLRQGDMTSVRDVPESVDVVSCVWALHHLPTREDAVRALREIARVRDSRGAAVWIFDFARLPDAATFRTVMDAVPGVPPRLYDDGIASEAAAWTDEELAAMLREAGLGDLTGGAERRIGHLQAWSSAQSPATAHDRLWNAMPLRPEAAAALAARLASGLDAVQAYS
jgi:ubiquinone/menaquinone biosynthesis C-methylase UbiE